jgi:hypothetical protein
MIKVFISSKNSIKNKKYLIPRFQTDENEEYVVVEIGYDEENTNFFKMTKVKFEKVPEEFILSDQAFSPKGLHNTFLFDEDYFERLP